VTNIDDAIPRMLGAVALELIHDVRSLNVKRNKLNFYGLHTWPYAGAACADAIRRRGRIFRPHENTPREKNTSSHSSLSSPRYAREARPPSAMQDASSRLTRRRNS
jgi:hypothetical protein